MERSRPNISATCPENIKTTLQRLAAADNRTLSNYIRLVLEKHVEEATADKSKKKVA